MLYQGNRSALELRRHHKTVSICCPPLFAILCTSSSVQGNRSHLELQRHLKRFSIFGSHIRNPTRKQLYSRKQIGSGVPKATPKGLHFCPARAGAAMSSVLFVSEMQDCKTAESSKPLSAQGSQASARCMAVPLRSLWMLVPSQDVAVPCTILARFPFVVALGYR